MKEVEQNKEERREVRKNGIERKEVKDKNEAARNRTME